jgi:hypothetical protein
MFDSLFCVRYMNMEREGKNMTKPQTQERITNPQLERQKQQYQTPSLEQHHYLSLTGVILSIGGNVVPNPLELQNPFDLQELQ